MFTNYLKVALRNISRQRFYSFINVFGLAVGLGVCMLLVLFIKDELGYDKYHSKSNRIYRIITEWRQGDQRMRTPINEYRLAPALETDFPEFEHIVRFRPVPGSLVQYEDIEYRENQIFFADKDVFNVFDFELISGDQDKILIEPFTILLSESLAQKYFKEENPVGKTLRFNDQFDATINGVYKDFPVNSHFIADILVSMETGKTVFNQLVLNNWGENSQYTYVLLPENLDPAQIEARFPDFLEKNQGEGTTEFRNLYLQPLEDIHLKSNYRAEITANSDIRYIYISLAIALFIMLIACINYMNLATARSVKRSKEIGVRKTLGSPRSSLIFQFLTESGMVTFFAFLLGLLVVWLALPAFNSFVGKSLSIDPFQNPGNYILFLSIVVIVSLLSGSYPAFYLSSFKASKIFKESSRRGSLTNLLRKGLVVFQYSISIILIISTIVIFNQWSFLRNKDLGYDRENLVLVPIPDTESYQTLKEQLLHNPNVLSVAASNKQLTGALSSNLGFKAEGFEPGPDSRTSIKIVTVDHDFLKTLDATFIEGRDFSREFGSDQTEGFVLNEAAVEMIGWDQAIGKWFETSDNVDNSWVTRRGNVIGVVKNFNMESLYNKIEPVVYFISESWINWMTIKVTGNNLHETIPFIKEKWTQYGPEKLFNYNFMDDRIGQLYRNEQRYFSLFTIFTIIAIFIASLGILGLSAFTAEQRTKEIGVRKVFGASTRQIIQMLLREFTYLVIIGFVLAAPLAFYIMQKWLEDFTYRIDIGIWPFALGAALAILFAWITAGYTAFKAAMGNPSGSLRYE